MDPEPVRENQKMFKKCIEPINHRDEYLMSIMVRKVLEY